MAISNYTELQSSIASWLARDDLTARVPDFITLYEADANRRIRIRQNTATSALTLAAGASSVALPSDFLEDIELNYNDQAESLNRMPFDMIDRMQTTSSPAGRPSGYAVSGSTIIFETEADVEYTINLRYYEKWDIATDTTNWLLTNAPDAYLFGALVEAAIFIVDPNLMSVAHGRREAATEWVLKADSRTKSARLTVDPALVAQGTFNITTG